MKFKGHVQEVGADTVTVRLTPDDGESEEIWEVERARFPEAWLRVGAMFELEIGPEEGRVFWIFNASYWTQKEVDAIRAEAKKLCERFGIPPAESGE